VRIFEMIGRKLARYLAEPGKGEIRIATCRPEQLAATLRKGDVLLVEGSSRFSKSVKYLTQSTWSHAALCVSDSVGSQSSGSEDKELVEADVIEGVRRVSLDTYANLHTRICRPMGITAQEIDQAVTYTLSRIGHQYDLKNIIDLARYMIQTPPVPVRWRRRLLALGSGDPTKAICSSLIAQAFQSIRYPILPEIVFAKSKDPSCLDCYNEFLHIRHHSLFVPRDFDISPYFQIIKPTLKNGFNPHNLAWISENENQHEKGPDTDPGNTEKS
jgi:hypothetical protein